jgi:hypothetical protein
MFNIIKRKKPLQIRFFTNRQGLANLFPPRQLSQDVPEWWKKTPLYLPLDPEMEKNNSHKTSIMRPEKLRKSSKHCYAIQETLKHAINFPLWCDAYLEVDHKDGVRGIGPGKANSNNGRGVGEQHPRQQYPGLLPPNYCNFKFNSAWVAFTEEYVPFWMCDPFYHKFNRDWQTMNGVIEFHYQHNLNVNLILRKPIPPKKNQRQQKIQYEFRAGDSVAYFVPMAHDRKIVVTAEEVSDKEWERLHWQHHIWFAHHKGMKKNNQGGCPIKIGAH